MPEFHHDWTIFDGEGGPDRSAVRRFTLHAGGGGMGADGDTGGRSSDLPEIRVLREAHEREIVRIRDIHREEMERIHAGYAVAQAKAIEAAVGAAIGGQWSAEASIRTLAYPEGKHHFVSDSTFVLELIIGNASPADWRLDRARAAVEMRWKNRGDRSSRWQPLRGQAEADPLDIGTTTTACATLRVQVDRETATRLRAVDDLAIDPGDVTLFFRRKNGTREQSVPVHLSEGPLTVRREPSRE